MNSQRGHIFIFGIYLLFSQFYFSQNVLAQSKFTCEVHGTIINSVTGQKIPHAWLHVQNRSGAYVDFNVRSLDSNTANPGTFIFTVNDTGLYIIRNSVRYCSYDTMHVYISPEQNNQTLAITYYVDCSKRAQRKMSKPRKIGHNSRHLMVETGISQGWRTMVEAGVGIAKVNFPRLGYSVSSLTAGSEINFNFRSVLLGHRITYTYHKGEFILLGMGFTGGVSAMVYHDSRNTGFYIRPQIGLTVVGSFDLVFQYAIPLVKSDINLRVNYASLGIKVYFYKRSWL
jgi:hypothetical protein